MISHSKRDSHTKSCGRLYKVIAPAQPAIIWYKRQLFNILLLQPLLMLTAKLESEPWLCPAFPYIQLREIDLKDVTSGDILPYSIHSRVHLDNVGKGDII